MKVFVIGDGNAAKFHIQAYELEGCEPASNIDEADLISIASPDDSHASYAIQAIERSKHVLVEKPPTHSPDEWLEIVKALDAHPEVFFACNLPLPFHPPFLDLKKRLNKDEFGEVYLIEGEYNYGRKWKMENGWRGKMPNYSILLGGGIHLLDLMLWLKNNGVVNGAAMGCNKTLPEFKNHDCVQAAFQFEDGSLGRLGVDFGYNGDHVHRLVVRGTKDRIAIENKVEVDKTLLIRNFVRNIVTKTPVSQVRLRQTMKALFNLERSSHE